MNTDCTYCNVTNSLRINHGEGNTVCLECGCVSEYDMWFVDALQHEPIRHDMKVQETFYFIEYATFPDSILQLAYDEYVTKIKERSYRGNPKRAVLANCLLNACIEYGVPTTTKEMAQICDIDQSLFLKMSTHVDHVTCTNFEMITKYTSILPFDRKVKMQYAKQVREWLMDDNILEGKSPHTRMTTFIYFAAMRENHVTIITKTFIVETYDISIVTLNKAIKEFLTYSSNF
jgi:transcription initiation factor TFIIIB Brf1 subunit/transcription initiation factor TFIIB